MNTNELDELYRETVLTHARHPHNKGELPEANATSEGVNPLCGDRVSLQLAVDNGRVTAARFRGSGCALSQASASMLTDAVTGLPKDEVERVVEGVERMLRGEGVEGDLGELEGLQGVIKFPTRVRCALLAWKVLRQALDLDGGGSATGSAGISPVRSPARPPE
jgi:nitrogen fixation protein NifU and related proteins